MTKTARFIRCLSAAKIAKTIDKKQRKCYTDIRGEIMSKLGQLIKNKREAFGLSQKKLGSACDLSDSEIMKIENGVRKKPNWENLCRIAQALDFHPFELLLAAGYICEEDIHPSLQLHGLENLESRDIDCLQLFIDFMISRKNTAGNAKGGL